ncbi:hypothetical protein [Proteus sp. CD3]|uniref:hypothetical protein n=1 Tax=Proteus sp. CD3 TaxID=1921565 RepID=UPI00124A24A4|nr:hypothetical protein [Proteus sp. CD3]QEZ91077.1 hypothetical protein BTA34_01400 [Proteus sp. CD3]
MVAFLYAYIKGKSILSPKLNLDETIHFLQTFINKAQLELKVSVLSESDFESIVKDNRSVLNWIDKFPHYLNENSFHMGFRLCTNRGIDGAMLGIYATSSGDLHIFLIESFIRNKKSHPLSERLTTLVIIASIFFLSQYTDSKGIYIVEPHKELIFHYEKFGFQLLDDHLAMYATFETLQKMQLSLMSKLLNNE